MIMAQKSIKNYFTPSVKADTISINAKPEVDSSARQPEQFSQKQAKDEKMVENMDTTEVLEMHNLAKDVKNYVKAKGAKAEEMEKEKSEQKRSNSASYDPSKPNYHPINDAFWEKDVSTPYLALAKTFQVIEEIRGRLKMIEILSNFLASVAILNSKDVLPCIYLSVNQLGPAYEGLELGVAEHTLMKAICKATGRELKHIKSQTNLEGDLGIVAEHSRFSQQLMFKPKPLTVQSIYQKLREVCKLAGPSKTQLIQDIFVACRDVEARYFIRSLIGKLRIGIAEQSLLDALALAVVKISEFSEGTFNSNYMIMESFKKKVKDVSVVLKTVYSQCPNYNIIIPELLKHGIQELSERCPMSPGVPLKPMLAQPTRGVGEVLERFENFLITCEWKYDGERAQIHCDENGIVNIFSRNQENNTLKYPDVISRVSQFKTAKVQSFITDSEIVAWDVEAQRILPFQILSTRKRKNVEVETIKVQVCVFTFDLLYLNGQSLVTKPFIERRRLLKQNFQEVQGVWRFPIACDTNDTNEIQRCLEESVKGNCEGLMVKTLDSEATYEIAKRSRNWLKLKKDYISTLGDSLDLVVIGGYKGKGKRTGTYGGYLLACYDHENEEYQSICKIGTGFSEDDLRMHMQLFEGNVLEAPKSYYLFDETLKADDWFEPIQVWEVKCADLSLSPIHKAAIGIIDAERGISLRFPRFIRVRNDKSPENATTSQQVADMYSSQDQIKGQQKASVDDLENDYY